MAMGSLPLSPLPGLASLENRAAARLDGARRELMTAKTAEGSDRERAMRKAARDFEAVFIGQMLQPMFAGIETDGIFGGGHAEEIFRSMLVEEMGKTIANAGGIGIADAVYRELVSIQETQQ